MPLVAIAMVMCNVNIVECRFRLHCKYNLKYNLPVTLWALLDLFTVMLIRYVVTVAWHCCCCLLHTHTECEEKQLLFLFNHVTVPGNGSKLDSKLQIDVIDMFLLKDELFHPPTPHPISIEGLPYQLRDLRSAHHITHTEMNHSAPPPPVE